MFLVLVFNLNVIKKNLNFLYVYINESKSNCIKYLFGE